VVAGGVLANAVAALSVALDGDSGGAKAGALHGDRAAPRAHVPHEISGTGTETSEDEGASLGLGYHAGAVLELSLG